MVITAIYVLYIFNKNLFEKCEEIIMDVLNEIFYHNKNGTYTKKHGVIGNCLSRNVFFILMHKMYKRGCSNNNDLYKAYLQDFNFNLIKNEDNIASVG
jgi:hypothetical protein